MMSASSPKLARRRVPHAGNRNADGRNQRGAFASFRSRNSSPAQTTSHKEDTARPDREDAAVPASGRSATNFVASRNRGQPGEPEKPLSGHNDRGNKDQEAPVLPGVKPVCELLQSAPERVDAVFLRKGRRGKDMERIIDLCRSAGVRFSLLEPVSFARVYGGPSQGVVARLFEAGFADLNGLLDKVADSPLPLVLALDQVQDPGNAGALARTLYALGGAGLIVPRHNGVYLGAAAAKAAAGALEKLPVAKAPNLGQAIDSAKKRGFSIYGAVSGSVFEGSGEHNAKAYANDPQSAESWQRKALPKDGAENKRPGARRGGITGKAVIDVFSLAPMLPAILILGSEEYGMRASMEKRCDTLINIPMLRDFDSLNVAQAGGIIISWFARFICAKSLPPIK
jgi:23S rRNA (guanosine2251-2'-O)-methyltransferase